MKFHGKDLKSLKIVLIRHRDREEGFMLLDILISLALLTLALTSIMPMYFYAYNSLHNSSYRIAAINVMNEQIEAIKMLDFQTLTDSDPDRGKLVEKLRYEFDPHNTGLGCYEKSRVIHDVHEYTVRVWVMYDQINDPNAKDIVIMVLWPTVGGGFMRVHNFFQISAY